MNLKIEIIQNATLTLDLKFLQVESRVESYSIITMDYFCGIGILS